MAKKKALRNNIDREKIRQDILSKLPPQTRRVIKDMNTHLKNNPNDFEGAKVIRNNIKFKKNKGKGKKNVRP